MAVEAYVKFTETSDNNTCMQAPTRLVNTNDDQTSNDTWCDSFRQHTKHTTELKQIYHEINIPGPLPPKMW